MSLFNFSYLQRIAYGPKRTTGFFLPSCKSAYNDIDIDMVHSNNDICMVDYGNGCKAQLQAIMDVHASFVDDVPEICFLVVLVDITECINHRSLLSMTWHQLRTSLSLYTDAEFIAILVRVCHPDTQTLFQANVLTAMKFKPYTYSEGMISQNLNLLAGLHSFLMSPITRRALKAADDAFAMERDNTDTHIDVSNLDSVPLLDIESIYQSAEQRDSASESNEYLSDGTSDSELFDVGYLGSPGLEPFTGYIESIPELEL